MRWIKSLISRDEPNDLRQGLATFFGGAQPADLYTVPELAETVHATRVDGLLTALAELTRDRVVDQIFRVESPKNKGGIDDFNSLAAVPDKIFDWRQDREIDVEPRMVRVLFRKHADDRSNGKEASARSRG
jgi:hypothetical protein